MASEEVSFENVDTMTDGQRMPGCTISSPLAQLR